MLCLQKAVNGFIALFFFCLVTSNFLIAKNKISKNQDLNEVMLPSQNKINSSLLISYEKSKNADFWKNFISKNGKWNISIDPVLQTPRFAQGESIKIQGYDQITRENIEEVALKFLTENQSLFNIQIDQLHLMRKDYINGKWYVTFKQYYKGMEVLLSNIDLRIYKNGKIMSFDIEFYNNITISEKENISFNQALDIAANSVNGKSFGNEIQSAEKKFILPVKNNQNVEFNIVYKITVNVPKNHSKYLTYISAKDGKILWRHNLISNAQEINARGEVKLKTPLSPKQIVPISNLKFKIGSNTFFTDGNAKSSIDLNNTQTLTSIFEGQWAKVSTEQKQRAFFSKQIEPGKDFLIDWNDSNSSRYERNLFYYTNQIHDFMKKLDPNLDCIDKPVEVDIVFGPYQGDTEVNAFSSGDSIVFINCQDESMRMADGPGVLYHEYGHSINTLFYSQKLGNSDGMLNPACQEGMADVTCAMMIDDPFVGIGVFRDDTNQFIRSCKNNMTYPDSATGESHNDGQILSGAFWDLRELTSLDVMRKLHHFARYGLPDDINDGIAFYKWFNEVIVADDDDGNLANGTPHFQEIFKAFNKHKIGSNLFFVNNFKHIPLSDTKETKQPYIVEFSINSNNNIFGVPDSVSLVYQVKEGSILSNPISLLALVDTNNNYRANIPPQNKGSEVFYYMTCKISYINEKVKFMNKDNTPFNFSVGLSRYLIDDFEKQRDWEIGSPDDDNTIGNWVRVKPNELSFPVLGIYKPGNNHTLNGQNCYTTGIGSTNPDLIQSVTESCPNGKTTLISPVYNLSNLQNPTIKYYQYFAQLVLGYEDTSKSTADIGLTTELSNDAGKNWKLIRTDTAKETQWNCIKFKFGDFLTPTALSQIRFTYHGGKGGYGFPASISSTCIDDFEILTENDEKVDVPDDRKNINTLLSYPNPFDNSVNIVFPNPSNASSVIMISDICGNEIYSSNEYSYKNKESTFFWNGCDDFKNILTSGVYVYTIVSENKEYTGKIIKK
ncbi:MAG: T9SS type A sorting domain-containing protein [Candidatus Kapabacteria bacterium]|nr:T9SS type A sorting domain-containing protein [Candidatus Kapabacteria bacterium]